MFTFGSYQTKQKVDLPQISRRLIFALIICLLLPGVSLSQAGSSQSSSSSNIPELVLPEPLLRDVNGDGIVSVDAFGDSITRGVGDFIESDEEIDRMNPVEGEAGYPLRAEYFLGVPVRNLGVPGERLTTRGLRRFARVIPERQTDIVIISGGTNDAIERFSEQEFYWSVQTMINIAQASGIIPVILTAPPTCCSGSGLWLFVETYNRAYRALAVVNEIELADVEKAYLNTCPSLRSCYLLNRPEGVHPNKAGYDVSSEVVMSSLLGINLFAPDGAALLEQAIGLSPGSVKTIPDPLPEIQ